MLTILAQARRARIAEVPPSLAGTPLQDIISAAREGMILLYFGNLEPPSNSEVSTVVFTAMEVQTFGGLQPDPRLGPMNGDVLAHRFARCWFITYWHTACLNGLPFPHGFLMPTYMRPFANKRDHFKLFLVHWPQYAEISKMQHSTWSSLARYVMGCDPLV